MAVNNMLNDMMTINIDLETLGVNIKDQVYSGAVYSNTQGTERSAQSFFNIDNGNYPSNTTVGLEDYLKTRHASQFFGMKQAERGSLRGWAEAVANQQTSGMNEYVKSIMDMHKEGNNGSILLAQNLQFENRALSNAFLTGQVGQPFTELMNSIVNRETSKPTSLLEASGISQLNWQRRDILMDAVRPSYLGNNKQGLNESLSSYYAKSMEIIDNYEDNIGKARATGGIALVDLMDYSKAVYAHGAVQGKIDPRMLQYGNKVEYLAQTLLGETETHEALSDAKHQDRLFKILSNEVAQMREKGLSYQSPIVDKLANGFESERVLEKQVKSSAISFVREYLENNPKDLSLEGIKTKSLKEFEHKNRFLIQSGTTQGFNFRDFRKDLDGIIDQAYNSQSNETIDRDALLYALEDRLDNYKHTPSAPKVNLSETLPKFSKNTAMKIGAVGATLFAGSMIFGGNKEEQQRKKYNTYDELYNNQYYGTQFADWENRNNSHKMM